MQPSQAIQPIGDLTVDLFPGDSEGELQTRVSHWLNDAAARIPNTLINTLAYDTASLAWVYYRAYTQVVLRLSRDPASATISGEGSSVITGEQIRTFKAAAASALASFDMLITAPIDGHVASEGTRSLPTQFVF